MNSTTISQNGQKLLAGIVEGFFSAPLQKWSWEERNKTLEFVQEYAPSINTYFYCPKDDELVTKYPYQLYPESELENFRQFIRKCEQANITFIYGLNPSFSEEELADIDVLKQKIVAKLKQLVDLGVKDICLLFDDIPIAYDVFEESATFSVASSENLINLVNCVYDEMSAGLDSFWFCSPDYNFNKETNLTKAVQKLNQNIKLFWTGNEIFSKDKSTADFERARRISGSDHVAIWDNYPVNDAEQNVGCFNLSGFYPVDDQVFYAAAGIYINPMREAFANLPFYMTFSQWWKQEGYDRDDAYVQALNLLGIDQDSVQVIKLLRAYNNFDQDIPSVSLEEFMALSPALEAVQSEYGNLFLDSISQIFVDFHNLKDLMTRIKNQQTITIAYFRSIDWFPTKTNVARYLNEIVGIVRKRMDLVNSAESNSRFVRVSEFNAQMNSRYKGKDRLKITTADNALILQQIAAIIDEEQRLFVDYLNNPSITPEGKFQMYIRRRAINRFFV